MTQFTKQSVDEFLESVSDKRRDEAKVLIDMMKSITGFSPEMYGPSIIGFGRETYSTKSGMSGEIPQLAFSPRKGALTIYFYDGFQDDLKELVDRVGKHRSTVSCFYVNKLSDINLEVLQEMLEFTYKQ